jgi:hypothetical protein
LPRRTPTQFSFVEAAKCWVLCCPIGCVGHVIAHVVGNIINIHVSARRTVPLDESDRDRRPVNRCFEIRADPGPPEYLTCSRPANISELRPGGCDCLDLSGVKFVAFGRFRLEGGIITVNLFLAELDKIVCVRVLHVRTRDHSCRSLAESWQAGAR